jgi:hypothetical protein
MSADCNQLIYGTMLFPTSLQCNQQQQQVATALCECKLVNKRELPPLLCH